MSLVSACRAFRPARTVRPHRGHALAEWTVIVAVMAVVAVVAVPRLGRAAPADTDTTLRGDLAVLRNAIELYAADHGGAYPPLEGFAAALTQETNGHGPYLQSVPGLDAGGRAGVENTVQAPSDAPQGFAAWLYDPHTGRIQPHPAAAR